MPKTETTMTAAEIAGQIQATEAELVEVREELDRVRSQFSRALVSNDFDSEDEAELEEEKGRLERRVEILEERLAHLRSPEIRRAVQEPRVRDRVQELADELREAGEGFELQLSDAAELQEQYLEVLETIARAQALQGYRRQEILALADLYDLPEAEVPDVADDMVELGRERRDILLGDFRKRVGESFRAGEKAGQNTRRLLKGVTDLRHNARTVEDRRRALQRLESGVTPESRDLVESLVAALEGRGEG